jgi:hypothetical protein
MATPIIYIPIAYHNTVMVSLYISGGIVGNVKKRGIKIECILFLEESS